MIHTLEHFEACPDIDAICIVCVSDWIDHLQNLLYKYRIEKVRKIIPGGASGQLSIFNGLYAAEELVLEEGTTGPLLMEAPNIEVNAGITGCRVTGNDEHIVLIHDGVRPLIEPDLLSQNIRCVRENGSCITAGIVKETIVEIYDNGDIRSVPERSHSRVAKAPQSFYLRDVISAHRRALSEKRYDFIDTCTMMNHYGRRLTMIDGPYENIKITTPDDFYSMRAILQAREDAQIYILE
jgi:2-C-methyl-D-erythritol 4-phosphate cytidylyltransferase